MREILGLPSALGRLFGDAIEGQNGRASCDGPVEHPGVPHADPSGLHAAVRTTDGHSLAVSSTG